MPVSGTALLNCSRAYTLAIILYVQWKQNVYKIANINKYPLL